MGLKETVRKVGPACSPGAVPHSGHHARGPVALYPGLAPLVPCWILAAG